MVTGKYASLCLCQNRDVSLDFCCLISLVRNLIHGESWRPVRKQYKGHVGWLGSLHTARATALSRRRVSQKMSAALGMLSGWQGRSSVRGLPGPSITYTTHGQKRKQPFLLNEEHHFPGYCQSPWTQARCSLSSYCLLGFNQKDKGLIGCMWAPTDPPSSRGTLRTPADARNLGSMCFSYNLFLRLTWPSKRSKRSLKGIV